MTEKNVSETFRFPVISLELTGKNIERIRKERGLSVKELQEFFGFERPQAIYKWQWGECLPSVDNLYALSKILNVPMQDILVEDGRDILILAKRKMNIRYMRITGFVRTVCNFQGSCAAAAGNTISEEERVVYKPVV